MNYTKEKSELELRAEVFEYGFKNNFGFNIANKSSHKGKYYYYDKKKALNCDMCSYMALEYNPYILWGMMKGMWKFGSQYSSSRVFSKSSLMREAEEKLDKLFQAHTVLFSSTHLCHYSVFPVLMQKGDAVIYDIQAHSSLQNMLNQVKKDVEIFSHVHVNSNMQNPFNKRAFEVLVQKVDKLTKQHKKVFIVIDSMYSMYGDKAPLKELMALLDDFENLHLYVDDAHGMSWAGKNGRGLALENNELHHRMYIGTSLAKGFGVSGGVFVTRNKQLRQSIEHFGNAAVFSGQVSPVLLGGIIASCKLHLRSSFKRRQEHFETLIYTAIECCRKYNIKLISTDETPIFFIPIGKSELAIEITRRLLIEGVKVNCAVYPAVALNKAGLRYTISNHKSSKDVQRSFQLINQIIEGVFNEFNEERVMIQKYFRKLLVA